MKNLVFKDSTGVIDVSFVVTLKDVNNHDENFTIQNIVSLENVKELRLFYAFQKGFPLTLNEMIYFAVCNELCLEVRDESNVLLDAFGTCGTVPPVGDFNYDYNDDYYV